jgi:hypothetical protein
MPSTGPTLPHVVADHDAQRGAVVLDELGDLGRLHVLVARRGHLERRRQVGPELEAVHLAVGVALRHLLVDDAAAGGHPLHVAGAERAAVAQAVGMLDGAGEHVGDGLDAAVRMPRNPRGSRRTVVAKSSNRQKRIELVGGAEPEGPAQTHAGALDRGGGLGDVLHGTDGHRNLLVLPRPVF